MICRNLRLIRSLLSCRMGHCYKGMLILIQIPVFDIRKFLDVKQELINKPNWKFLEDSDVLSKFVRSIGPIEIRKTGQTSLGENYYSKARRGIRFKQLPVIKVSEGSHEVVRQIKPRFRRFFFDGTVCGKYEIGFSVELEKQQYIADQSFRNFLDAVFATRVVIPIPFNKKEESTIVDCGRFLAKQYLYATTHRKGIDHDPLLGVYAGIPCVYVEKKTDERIQGSVMRNPLMLNQPQGISVALTKLSIGSKLIKVWYAAMDPGLKSTAAREIRIAILRLNVFREALHFVFRKIEENNILPKPRSIESEELQSFFKDCFGKYLRKIPDELSNSDYESLAIQIEDKFAVANRKQLEDNLRKVIDIRGNYFYTIKAYLDKVKDPDGITTIKVLVVFSNPSGTEQLKLGNEDKVIKEAIRRSNNKNNIEIDTCHSATVHDLRRALLDKEYKIVHISGHGSGSGLLFEDDSGEANLVPQHALADLFGMHRYPQKGKLECVLLNACYSMDQGEQIALGIPYTIAMEGAISDSASIEFSRGFYDAIGANKDIQSAYDEGCIAVGLARPGAQFMPQLLKKV